MPTVYAYRRRSVARRDQVSVRAQTTALTDYYTLKWGRAKPVVPLVTLPVDEGVSGAIPLIQRPAGRDLFRRLYRGDHIIVAKLDRIWRSVADGAIMLQWCEAKGVHLHILDLGIDTTTPAGRMAAHMLMAVAQFERERTGERRIAANTQRRKEGKPWFGRNCPPLGWRIVGRPPNRQFKPNHPERATLRRMLRMHESGLGYRRLERRLRELGRTNRQGRPWTRSGIRRALWAAKNGFPIESHDCRKWGSVSSYKPQWHKHRRLAQIPD